MNLSDRIFNKVASDTYTSQMVEIGTRLASEINEFSRRLTNSGVDHELTAKLSKTIKARFFAPLRMTMPKGSSE